MRFTCQLPVARFISSATPISLPKPEKEDTTLPLGSSGIQLSLYTIIDFPSPTLHLAHIIIILLVFKILFQAKETEVCFASKIVRGSI